MMTERETCERCGRPTTWLPEDFEHSIGAGDLVLVTGLSVEKYPTITPRRWVDVPAQVVCRDLEAEVPAALVESVNTGARHKFPVCALALLYSAIDRSEHGRSDGHCPVASYAEIKRLRAEVERLQAIVDRLPKTADGVVVLPGMKLYAHDGNYIESMDVGYKWEKRDDSSHPSPVYHLERYCYSTHEAAEAARDDANEQETP